MKILYLSHRIPYPPNKGDKIRSFNEIKYLSKSHEVHLSCLADNPSDLIYEDNLTKYCKKVCLVPHNTARAKMRSLASLFLNRPLSVGYFYSKSLQATVNRWLSSNHYDAIICFSSPMAEYIFRSPLLNPKPLPSIALAQARQAGETRNPKLIMDFCDVDSDKWLQYSRHSRFPLNLVYATEHRRLLKYEKRINQFFDHSVFVSQQEANLFSTLYPEARNVAVIPNGVDHEYFSPYQTPRGQKSENRSQRTEVRGQRTGDRDSQLVTRNSQPTAPLLLFTGAMDYHANVDAVTWFCDRIFPIVKTDFPEAQFYIVGSNPHPKVKDLENRNGIKVTGYVEDIRPYYQMADVFVAPLRLARGIQNKVLEAMAMGKAVVTTAKGVEGIVAVPKTHLIVEDIPERFANAVSTMINDPSDRKHLGEEARQFVKGKYNWPTNMKKFGTLLQAG